jgi:putative PEP-CTERM system histidine kinase
VVSYSFVSYFSAAIGFGILFFFLILNRKNNSVFFPFAFAAFFSLIWASFATYILHEEHLYIFDTFAAESLRNGAWYFFLSVLISKQQFNSSYSFLRQYWQPKLMLIAVALVAAIESMVELRYQLQEIIGLDIRMFAHIGFAVVGLILVEQLYRNALAEQRWHIKFVCIASAAMFLFDFIVYSKSLLFTSLDIELWNARGLINALLCPLLIISINRLNEQPVTFRVSRKIIFHTTVMLGAGLYLLIMSLMGFYIRDFGGSWGALAQISFIFLAILLLLVFFVSGTVRAQLKVFLSKHLFQHRYDYREEWIRLSKTLAQMEGLNEVSGYIIKTLADLVDSSGGGVWLKNRQGDYYLTESIIMDYESLQLIDKDNALIRFLAKTEWVIDFVEFVNDPDIYAGAGLEHWHEQDNNIWLIVPLCVKGDLEAFVVLSKPRLPRQIDWQDHDLLKTVAMQLANALALTRASEDLSTTRQFEAYSRMSAFLVHDLKNLIAQIAMIVKNSEKHRYKPEFIDDSIDTLENAVQKMERILKQLQKGSVKETDSHQAVDLVEIVTDVAVQQASMRPQLQMVLPNDPVMIKGEPNKLCSIFTHLVQNAQDATPETGSVALELTNQIDKVIVKIIDSGCGMDKEFIQQRLFKPFDTTKGNAGMGIGVYEAREYVLQHSGHMFVDSELGKGTTFTVQFPII